MGERAGRGLALGGLALGVATATAFLFRPDLWWYAAGGALAVGGALALLPSWRGRPRDGRALASMLAAFHAPALGLPLVVGAAAFATGNGRAFVDGLAVAAPRSALAWIASVVAGALGVLLALDGARPERTRASALSSALVGAFAIALATRIVWIASAASLPSEIFWSDGTFLVNALKLAAHEPIYGPPAALDTYTYSPLVDLEHRALLAPLGLALSLRASRVVVVLEQLGAAAVLVWTVWPMLRERAWAVGALALASLANLVAPSVHPDHGVLACVAIAFALVLAEDRWRRAAWWIALVLVTPVAASFKLSGGGIGLGLAAIAIIERRWRMLGALALSGAMCLATIPLFDATVGAFHFYALDVQRACPIVWSALADLPRTPFGLAAVASLAHAGAVARVDRAAVLARPVARAALLGAGVSIASIPGYIKYCGRDNNLTPILVVSIVVIVVVASRHASGVPRNAAAVPRDAAAAKLHPALAPLLALVLVVSARPPEAPVASADRAAVRADMDAIVATLHDDAAAGRSTLALIHVAAWIEAGRRDVPHDRLLSALELHLASRPEASLLVAHLEERRYDTVVAAGPQLADDVGLRGEYDVRVRRALEAGYDVVYPPGASSAAAVRGAVILRRRVSSSSR